MRVIFRPPKTAGIFVGLLVITAILLVASGCTQQAPPTTTTQVPATPSAPAVTTVLPGVATSVAPVSTVRQTPALTAENTTMVTFTESDNGATKQIAVQSPFVIQLAENPTTGYSWNATTSPGLEILSSGYQENSHTEGMVGVGGTRAWTLMSNVSGTYTFAAVYSRSWETTTGNETGYNITIIAVQS
ncbi:protease inhibitor I42 family protein [Methanoregula sp.]|uniref:protease inhibitor I42 family protein n=1 Tax=Methanoregula sp. TaxID=2052170 RepID=UPI003C74B8AB